MKLYVRLFAGTIFFGCSFVLYFLLVSDPTSQDVTQSNENEGANSADFHKENFGASSQDLSFDDIAYMRKTLPKTLSNFRNPCWLERYSQNYSYTESFYYKYDCQQQNLVVRDFELLGTMKREKCTRDPAECTRLRCFPAFFVVGAPKSGTTDIYHTLSHFHPHFVAGTRKEAQFWTRRRHGVTSSHKCPNETGHKATFSDYMDLYDLAAVRIQNVTQNKNKQLYHPGITGDFTPDNLFHLWDWESMPGNEGQPEPRVTLAHQLHHLSPGTKIIIILRDPVTRFLSHYYFVSKNLTPESLDKKVATQISYLNKCLKKKKLRNCAYTQYTSLIIGMYSTFVRDWLDVFPTKQTLVLHFEDYTKDRSSVLKQIVEFLGLDMSLCGNNKYLWEQPPKLHGRKDKPIWASTEERLRDFYRPYNKELVDILKDQKWTWGY